MTQYILPILATFALSAVLTPIVRDFALKKGYFDNPAPRKIHGSPTPRLGGIAIFISFILVIIGFLIFAPDRLAFTDKKILGIDQNLLGVILGGLVLVGAGIYDDIKGLNPFLKFFFQLIAAGLVALFGIKIFWLSNPFGNVIVLGSWSAVLVIFWIVLMTNVVNWLDGLDGLATGVSGIAALTIFILSLQSFVNQPYTALLAIIVFGACLGFLPYNFNPAKIFLGDSGAMFLGFIIAVLAIISGGKIATAFLVLGIPIFDAIWVILRRIFHRQAPWTADAKHLHHRFLQTGLTQRQAVLILYGLSASFGLLSLFSQTRGKFWAAIILVGIMLILATILIILEKRKSFTQNNIKTT
jgi:UDP-GlcNAc:undecaprenyl-phosphate GlcNAc-1-phosphate transferase